MKRDFLLVLLLVFVVGAQAQTNQSKKYSGNYKNKPVWIEMMNDPNANYFETLKAFREYWRDRVLPKEPFETEGAEQFEKEVGLLDDTKSEKEREREERNAAKHNAKKGVDYAAEVRAFKGWMQTVKPWLKPDGSIYTEAERQNLVDAQTRELKEIELKNTKK